MIDSDTFLSLLDSMTENYAEPALTIHVSREKHQYLMWYATHGMARYRRSVRQRQRTRRQHRAAFRRRKAGLA